ncbi:MAG: ACP phosphodiesterase [Verrucomicrobia bacterium]|nr:ACP phosphodiesterase [Verrucomicrobiota bacterium]
MNYLAHVFLAHPTDASRIGNLLGDFVRGTPDSLCGPYPDAVVDGIVMHRALDRFTDTHPAFLEARALLAPERRRFAGIIVDIFFDHFLTQHWSTFSDQALPNFVSNFHDALERHPDWLSDDLRRIQPRMRKESWLESYGTIPGIDLTLRRVSTRSPRLTPIADGVRDLTDHYHSLDRAFHAFFPDAQTHAATL